MIIEFSDHAKEKLAILRVHDIKLSESQIKEVVLNPKRVLNAWEGRLIAEKDIDQTHILRVVYKKEREDKIRVITMYPARKGRY